MNMKLIVEPLFDNVLIKYDKKGETKTDAGILIPESKEKPTIGEVVAVGEGKIVDGKLQPMRIAIGDKVVFGKYSGSDLDFLDGFVIIKEEEIYARMH